ncbi:MAG: Coenzyme F420 hydrogenase/dehydrogenase, beta subunit C-terminal domain [Clostridiales bacterium]|nr:Coenzyme F420 hydrogenase/dehydrogenase, beta subunit C-terminal domain [Clostridiales bacterium]
MPKMSRTFKGSPVKRFLKSMTGNIECDIGRNMQKINNKITISVVKKSRCTGCSACSNKCPAKAIEMQYDNEGFIFPFIKPDKCIHCGLCVRVCPTLSISGNKIIKKPIGECFAAMAKDDIRAVSSSGGIFHLLAESIYDQGGCVSGAVFSEDYKSVHHILSETKDDLPLLRGSKYIQSEIGDTYIWIKDKLKKNIPVLFVGCPCQVAGLYSYLEQDYECLYTVDLVCHGQNSREAYLSYVSEIADGREIQEVNFRDKKEFGWSTPMTIYFKDGSKYSAAWNKNDWNTGFLQGIINRKSCGTCHYATRERVGDITLGDFWQVHKWDQECNDWKGTSLVLVNSEKGRKLYGQISSKLKLNKAAPIEEAVKYNGSLSHPCKTAEGRPYFFKHLQEDGYRTSLWYGQRWRYDVGLVGWWFSANYGSVMTYYALGKVIMDMGILPILIRIPKLDNGKWEAVTEQNIEFMKKYFLVTKERKFEEMPECNQFCDTFMVGSDQLWVHAYTKLVGYTFYLDFVNPSRKKIAYATSLGYANYGGTQEEKEIVKILLERFDAVSARETSGVDICENEFKIDAVRKLDPVFLCDTKYYDELARNSSLKEDGYILCYILDPTDEKREAIRWLENKYRLRSIIVFDMKTADVCSEKWKGENIFRDVSCEDFIYLIKNCEYLFTDSHHGVCFGLIYHKQFAAVANARRGITRFESLFSLLEIEHMLIDENMLMTQIKKSNKIDYKVVDQILEKERMKSKDWLYKNLIERKEQSEVIDRNDLFAKQLNMCMRLESAK